MTLACSTNPDRWTDPDPQDVAARALCRSCPRRQDCAQDALRTSVVGLWAGVIIPSNLARGDRRVLSARNKLRHIVEVKMTDAIPH